MCCRVSAVSGEDTVSADLDIEAAARVGFANVLESGIEPSEIDPDLDMAESYGLTSLNKVLFLMSVCDDTNVNLSSFTEPDVAAMRTLSDVITALAAQAHQVA
jgi:hypothetical protein